MTNAITFQSAPMNIFELCEMMKAGKCNYFELPSFDGEKDTPPEGVWSWDESRMIVGECPDDFEVVWRPLKPYIESANSLTYSVFLNGYRTFSLFDLIENDHIDLDYVGEIEVDSDYNTVADVPDGVTQIVGHIKDFLTPKVVEEFIDALIAEIDWGSILLAYLGNDYERLFLSWSDYEWKIVKVNSSTDPLDEVLLCEQVPTHNGQPFYPVELPFNFKLLPSLWENYRDNLEPIIKAQLMERWNKVAVLRQQMTDLGYGEIASELEEDENWWRRCGYAYQSNGIQKADMIEHLNEEYAQTTNHAEMLGLLDRYFDIFMESSCTDESS